MFLLCYCYADKLHYLLLCRRNVINVGRSSSPTTPSTTAVPAERASVTPAPPKPGRSLRGAGVLRLLGSVMRVSTTEEFQLVHKWVSLWEFKSAVLFAGLVQAVLMFTTWYDLMCACCRVAGRCVGGGGRHPDSEEGWRGCPEHFGGCSWCHRYTSW